MEKEMINEEKEMVKDAEIISEETEVKEEVESKEEEKETVGDLPSWMSFVVGVRGNGLYQSKTNLKETTISDYTEALAGLDMNVILLILKAGGIKAVENFFKMKEILVLNSVRLLENSIEELGIEPEQYDELRSFFNINEIEKLIETRKQEMVDGVTPEAEKEEKIEIEY